MEVQDYLVVLSAFLLAAGIGFAIHQFVQTDSSDEFSQELDLRVDSDNPVASTEFDGNNLELRYEDSEEAKFYFKFNDTRGVQQIEDLKQDGTLQTKTEIKSFGNKTYFLYLRYRDDPNQTGDGFMELYRVEEA